MHKFLVIVLILLGGVCFGQNTRNTEAPKPPRPQYQATKVEKKSFLSFLKKKDRGIQRTSNQSEIQQFRANVAQRQREKAKIEYKLAKLERKEEKKGKSFFGHKKPPKKRPPGKQKFCKICRIKH
ncbi:MAG: hypothetical protein AAFY41_02810 [Bacteroidota bacterium]